MTRRQRIEDLEKALLHCKTEYSMYTQRVLMMPPEAGAAPLSYDEWLDTNVEDEPGRKTQGEAPEAGEAGDADNAGQDSCKAKSPRDSRGRFVKTEPAQAEGRPEVKEDAGDGGISAEEALRRLFELAREVEKLRGKAPSAPEGEHRSAEEDSRRTRSDCSDCPLAGRCLSTNATVTPGIHWLWLGPEWPSFGDARRIIEQLLNL